MKVHRICSCSNKISHGHLQFLSPKALSFVQSSLGSEYSESLGPAAPVYIFGLLCHFSLLESYYNSGQTMFVLRLHSHGACHLCYLFTEGTTDIRSLFRRSAPFHFVDAEGM